MRRRRISQLKQPGNWIYIVEIFLSTVTLRKEFVHKHKVLFMADTSGKTSYGLFSLQLQKVSIGRAK